MEHFAITDVGMVRAGNEDTFLEKEYEKSLLLAVFDGMGGAKAGETASAMARRELEEYFNAFMAEEKKEPAAIQAALASAADSANQKILTLSKSDKEYDGMGTTMVAALVCSGKLYIANIGDSRAYLIDGGGAVQITRDHSFVQYLVDMGKLTPEEARDNPKKNIITRAVGVSEELSVDVSVLEKKQFKGKTLLLCSDGLSNYIDDSGIKALCDLHSDCEAFARALVAAANEAGGGDNITAAVAKL